MHDCALGSNEHVLLIRMSLVQTNLLRTLVVRVGRAFPLLSSGQYRVTASLYSVPSSIWIRKRCWNPTRTCFEHNAVGQRQKIGMS